MNTKIKTHQDGTPPTNRQTIFVFGSNDSGIHGAGAAAFANKERKLPYGQGQRGYDQDSATYGIATKNANIDATLTINDIEKQVTGFIRFAKNNPDLNFHITRFGCGLAGLHDSQVAILFQNQSLPNCSFPDNWLGFLTTGVGASFERVLSLVSKYHRNQYDKAGQPYLLHLLRVVNSVAYDYSSVATIGIQFDEVSACIALAHDLLEDTECTEAELVAAGGLIGPAVLEGVRALTKWRGYDSGDHQHTAKYVNKIAAAGSKTIKVKLADILDNSNLDRLPAGSKYTPATVSRLEIYDNMSKRLQEELLRYASV